MALPHITLTAFSTASILRQKFFFVKAVIIASFFLEFSFLTFFSNALGPYLSPLVLFASSLTLGLCLLWKSLHPPDSKLCSFGKAPGRATRYICIGIAILGIGIISTELSGIFRAYPYDFHHIQYSDIIPQIGILVNRFLDGAFPYQTISAWGYDLFPTYLPLQWMPYILAEISGIDYRWIAFGVLGCSVIYFQFQVLRSSASELLKCFLTALPLLCWYIVIVDDRVQFGITVESLIAGYYFFLAAVLFRKSRLLLAAAILLCLFSRYAIVLWLPLLILVQFYQSGKKTLWLLLYLFLGFLMVYGLPFLWHVPAIFKKGYAYHSLAALAEWAPSWQAAGEKPMHLFRGMGFASWFYSFIELPLADRLSRLQSTHLITSLGSVILMSIFYIKSRKRIHNKYFLLASLKIYFCFFYSFIQIPYSYLMIVPLFVSIAVVFRGLE